MSNLFLGIELNIPNHGPNRIKGVLLSSTFDAPAKTAIQSFTLYSGFYGCPCCTEKGQTCWTSEKGHKTVYPYNLNYACGHSKLRTHDEAVKHANIAHQKTNKYGKQHSEYRVKGLNWLYTFKYFGVIKSVGIDYTHSILLGVVKKLLEAWFSSAFKLKPWYIGHSINILDKKLRNIKTLNVIGRIPRSFNDLKQ